MNNQNTSTQATSFRWVVCAMLFAATMVNYLDRQVLSLTWNEFIKPEFHWTDSHYGTITAVFSFVYALSMIFAGRFVDWIGSRKGYLWAIGVWSVGACLHAFCGIITERYVGLHSAAELAAATGTVAVTISTVSMYCFLVARSVLAIGEAGNFPAAVKITAEYFPMRDRAFATSIFNAGSSIGALASPLLIPVVAKHFGWEMAFIIIGALGFMWMGVWVFVYDAPRNNRHVNEAELKYIEQDNLSKTGNDEKNQETTSERQFSILECLGYRQTWAFIAGKFFTDGAWWFFLFWVPSYIEVQFGIKTTEGLGMALIFTLYAITMLSIVGGKIPTIIINKTSLDPYAARMRAMLIYAFLPLVVLFAQPLGAHSPWYPIILIGLACAAHQSWSANIYTTVSDMFPKSAVATIIGLGSMAGGLGSVIMNKTAGNLFDYAEKVNLSFGGFEGKPAGYFIIFCVCAVSYLVAWVIMKTLVPRLKPIV